MPTRAMYNFTSRNPNKPRPVPMFWPAYQRDTQHYLHVTRNMTSDAVKSHLLEKKFNLWKNIIPAVQNAIRDVNANNVPKQKTKETEHCHVDGDCEP